MQRRLSMIVISGLLVCIASSAKSQGRNTVAPQPDQLISRFEKTLPFSFTYDRKSSKDLLGSWHKSETIRSITDGRNVRTVTYTDPHTQLELTWEVTRFPETQPYRMGDPPS